MNAPTDDLAPTLQGFLDKLRLAAEVVQTWLREPEIARWLNLFNDPAKLAAMSRAIKEMPAKLKDSLRDTGRVLHPDLTGDDVLKILSTYEEDGTQAVIALVDAFHAELVADERFRTEVAARWTGSRRWPILSQVFQAHDLGLFSVSIPTALSLAEGLVVEYVGHSGQLSGRGLAQYAIDLSTEDKFFGPIVEDFVTGLLLRKFEHGVPPPAFNRHAILHGADLAYGTKENSVLAIIWLDYLMYLHNRAASAEAQEDE
jgi:hypothetical protein